MRYYSKPEFVDAVQWTGDNLVEVEDFCDGFSLFDHAHGCLTIKGGRIVCWARPGDYVTRTGGDINVISKAAFERKYRVEGEESTPIYIIEFRAKGGEWQIFDMDGDRSRERAELYIPSNQVAYPDCEFRVVKYQRVEGK